MIKTGTWWRRWASVFAACVMAVLIVGPNLDAALCSGDGLIDSAPTQAYASAPAVQQSVQVHHSEPVGQCQHAHVQAPAACVANAVFVKVVPVVLIAAQTPDSIRLPPSAVLAGLERPPRV